jgi:hypothetical protein
MSKPLEENLSREIAQRIKSNPKNSFDNSYKATLLHDSAMYVQGFLVGTGKPYKPIEHSWLEFDEYLVDPTLPHLTQMRRNSTTSPHNALVFSNSKLLLKKL